MKVLMIARNTLKSSPGGDTVQIESTATYLRRLGVIVDIVLTKENVQYSDYELIHFFNIIRPDDILPHIKRTGCPFIVSTIFVDYSEFEKNNRSGLIQILSRIFNGDHLEYIKAIARFIKNGDKINSLYYLLRGHRASIKLVTSKARLLLPNSHHEYERFEKAYKIKTPYRKVTNAVDLELFNTEIIADSKFADHVLCVGRIEGRKNQLNLIKALANTGLKLTLIGKPSPNHMEYYEECCALASSLLNVQIVGQVEQKELASIYKAAKVHVLASWFETTGLSSLEAAVMDCNIVVTKKGDTEEYFNGLAYYCEPDDILSIRDSVLRAFNSDVNPLLKKVVSENYTWEKAASQTLSAYKEVLK